MRGRRALRGGRAGHARSGQPGLSGRYRCRGSSVSWPQPALLWLARGTWQPLALRFIAAGVTDRTVRTDADVKVIVEVGYGQTGAQPASFTWHRAEADLDWLTTAVAGADNDEDQYIAGVDLPGPGTYDVGGRVSADGGNSWAWCDLAPPVGYDAASALVVTTRAQRLFSRTPCGEAPGLACAPAEVGTLAATDVVDLSTPSRLHPGRRRYRAVRVDQRVRRRLLTSRWRVSGGRCVPTFQERLTLAMSSSASYSSCRKTSRASGLN